jgi:hypothetical protein
LRAAPRRGQGVLDFRRPTAGAQRLQTVACHGRAKCRARPPAGGGGQRLRVGSRRPAFGRAAVPRRLSVGRGPPGEGVRVGRSIRRAAAERVARLAASPHPSDSPAHLPSGRVLRPLLTPAARSGSLTAAPVASATNGRSPEVSPTAFGAPPPDLRLAALMDSDFATVSPLVRRARLVSGSCPSARASRSALLSDSASRPRPCASRSLRLHQAGKRTSTSCLLDMLGTQRKARATQPGPRAGGGTYPRAQKHGSCQSGMKRGAAS